jgi:hypothetical protein
MRLPTVEGAGFTTPASAASGAVNLGVCQMAHSPTNIRPITDSIGGAKITFDSDINWDGKRLTMWATTHAGRILCEAHRDIIHCLSIYNDAIGWEIDRCKFDIMERLKPAFFAKISAKDKVSNGAIVFVRLDPEDL